MCNFKMGKIAYSKSLSITTYDEKTKMVNKRLLDTKEVDW